MDSHLKERLLEARNAVRKATEQALDAAAREGPVLRKFKNSSTAPHEDSTEALENEDPNTSSSASFALGMTLFGQDVSTVERDICEKLNKVEEELKDIVVTVQKRQSTSVEDDEYTDTADSVESLDMEARQLTARIQFLRECSSARAFLDEASVVSSAGTANDPDYVGAARLLANAQHALHQAEAIVQAEEDRASEPTHALFGAYRILEAIRDPIRRKRVDLLSKATILLESSITLSSDSISVKGARLGAQSEGIHAAYDVLKALAPDDDSRWNDILRRLTNRLFDVILRPVLDAHKNGTATDSQWNFQDTSDGGNKGLTGRLTVTASKLKGPNHTLEWSREDSHIKSTNTHHLEEVQIIAAWGATLHFIQRIMSFVEERVLLQREPLRQYVGLRLFGNQADRPRNSIDLQALGLESNLIGDDTGLVTKNIERLLWDTCVPSYLEANELTQLKELADKLRSHVESFEAQMVDIHFLSKKEGDDPKHFPLSNFASNFQQKYVERRRCTILVEARRILLHTDYHNTLEVGVDVSGEKDDVFDEDDGMSVFQLHKSSISQTSSKIMGLCRQTMDEAVSLQVESPNSPLAQLPPMLYRTAREILDLFRAIIPATHGSEISIIPRTAAVLHNDSVFFAHHCLTIGLEYKEKFPPISEPDDARGHVLRQTCTFVDMVPTFRELADRSMGDMLERQQVQLWEVVGSRITLLGEALQSNEGLVEWSDAETALKAGLYHLRHLSQAWRPILSREVYVRSIGHLADTMFTMVIDQVMKATAISEPACHFVSALFRSTMRGVSELLYHDVKGCRSWDRFSAVACFMDMSLSDIHAALSEGVFRSVTAPELSRLIVATFDESDKRRVLLKALASEK